MLSATNKKIHERNEGAQTFHTRYHCFLLLLKASAQNQDGYIYKPESQELYNTIVHMDSVYFNAYNDCDMDKQAAIYADSIEFYHDGSGLETSKKALLAAIKQNICGKVSRVLVKGSIEVYRNT